MARTKLKAPCAVDGDFAEEVDHHQQILEAKIPFSHFDQQIIGAIAMEGVAQLLVAARAIFFFRLLRIEHTAERIVPAAAIGDDASQPPAPYRNRNSVRPSAARCAVP